MTKKNQTQKADIVLKSYWRENEPFADFFNAVHFGGRAVIKPVVGNIAGSKPSAVGNKKTGDRIYKGKAGRSVGDSGSGGSGEL